MLIKRIDITFNHIYPNSKLGEYGSHLDPDPYFGLSKENMKKSLKILHNKDEIVIEKKKINVEFKYPFKDDRVLELVAPNGKFFTRAQLGKAIAKQYWEIYDEEKESTENKKTIVSKYKKGQVIGELYIEPETDIQHYWTGTDWVVTSDGHKYITDGVWGIWGHELDDLYLTSVYTTNKEKDLFRLEISH